MTDNEIIKALECCSKKICKQCPNFSEDIECSEKLINLTLDYIARQLHELQERYEEAQTEIERLNKVYQANQQLINALNKSYFLAKAEAYKECVAKVRKLAVGTHPCSDELRVFDSDLDNLVKEMVGENNDL